MLSSTSYLFPPCCWVLSWAHQLIQRPSLWHGLGGLGRGEIFTPLVPKQPRAGCWPPGARVLLLQRAPHSLMAHPRHAHGSSGHGRDKLLFSCMSPREGCSNAVGQTAPALGTPRVWSL